MRTGLLILATALLLPACGGSPTSPTLPRDVLVIPEATLVPIEDPLDYPSHGPVGWTFQGHGQNTGQGCAVNVKAAVTLFRADDTIVRTFPLELPAAQKVRPRDVFLYEGVMSDDEALVGTGYYVVFTWTNVAC